MAGRGPSPESATIATLDTAGRAVLVAGTTVVVSMLGLLVIGLAALLLLVSFRSVVIPLTAAVMNLLSVAAAFGVVALALQGGTFGQMLGIDSPTPDPGVHPGVDLRGAVRAVDGYRGRGTAGCHG